MIGIHTKRTGEFHCKVIRPDGNVKCERTFPNLILNSGLDALGNLYANIAQRCDVGTGTSTPDIMQTQLDARLATKADSTFPYFTDSISSSAPYHGIGTAVYTFAAGTATGNISEIGIGMGTTDANPLFCRALVVDEFGVPTTITVLADEILEVTYICRQYPPTGDVAAIVTIGTVDYDTVIRPAYISSSLSGITDTLDYFTSQAIQSGQWLRAYETQVLGAETSAPAGVPSGISVSGAYSTYVAGDYFQDITGTFALANGNFATGIGSVVVNTTRGAFQISFSPKIPKDDTMVLTLTFRFSWNR